MSKKKFWIGAVAAAILGAAGAGAWLAWPQLSGKFAKKASPQEVVEYKYVNLDKVIVMLRDNAGGPMAHYLALDLVFKTTAQKEKATKEHLPLLRSVALKALADYPMDKASRMSIDQFSQALNQAFTAAYARDRSEKPFTEALIGKLIIE